MPEFLCSYAHGERDGVRPVVGKPKAAGLSVWWDTEIVVGNVNRA